MSFILDALRKSESERQQDRGPSITRIPSAIPQHGVPRWAVMTMAALGLGVVVLGGAWIGTVTMRSDPEPVAATRTRAESANAPETYAPALERSAREGTGSGLAASRRVETLPLPPPRAGSFEPVASPSPEDGDFGQASPLGSTAGSATPGGEAPADARRDPAYGVGGTSPLAEAARRSLAMAARTQTSGARSATPTASRQSLPPVEGIPEPYHSVAPSLGLPALTLELLAYGDTPDQQFVFIDGARYEAGDTLPGGARVIAINARGAVLLVDGRQLQLEPR